MLLLNGQRVEPGSAKVYPTLLGTYDVKMRELDDAGEPTGKWIHLGETDLWRQGAEYAAELMNGGKHTARRSLFSTGEQFDVERIVAAAREHRLHANTPPSNLRTNH